MREQELARLRYFNLANNNIQTLPEGFTSTENCLTRLAGLYLSGNNLTSLPPRFGMGATNLERVFLNDNGIVGPVPEAVLSWPHLEFLDLSRNSFTGIVSLSKALLSAKTLRGIWLHGNPGVVVSKATWDLAESLETFSSGNYAGLE